MRNYKNLLARNLYERFDYNPNSGKFTWLGTNEVVGRYTPNGYVQIWWLNKLWLAHRLAWLYVHDEMPDGVIDHINGDRADNRISNLRLATQSQNCANSKMRKNNTSGYKGVSWFKAQKKWRASLGVRGKRLFLGLYDKIEDAHAAYVRAAKKEFGEFSKVA